MIRRIATICAVCVTSVFGGYTYDYTGYGTGSAFAANGSISSPSGYSNIYLPAVSGANPNDYEVETTIGWMYSGGTIMHFLRASSSTVLPGTGSYVSVELNLASWPSATTLTVNQCVSGTVTLIGSTGVTFAAGQTIRSVIWGSTLWVFINNILQGTYSVTPTTGQPGYGGYGMSDVAWSFNIGHHDTVAPSVVSGPFPRSVYSSSVAFQWQPSTDDTNGIGMFRYEVYRDGGLIGYVQAGIPNPVTQFDDTTAGSSATHTYAIDAVDFHGNVSAPTSFSLTTPPASFPDPRRTGIFTAGSYWGGGGEQIDTLSGNLNFSLPLVKAMGRTGWSVPVGLTYNSQNWRQDSGVNWQLGFDVGLGFGWKMLIGSITPFYAVAGGGVDHYIYTNATGAEYRLNLQSGSIWSSAQGIYIWFDASANILHFKDGTFWVMGSTSGGDEPDAGALYPTTIEDVGGNQVVVAYDTAEGLIGSPNTSSRIVTITDVREPCTPSLCATYTMTYSYPAGSTLRHLASISNSIHTAENFTFSYTVGGLAPPFGYDPNYLGWTAAQLTGMTTAALPAYVFAYDTAGAGELTNVTFPYGGQLGWVYNTFTYSNNRLLREVGTREILKETPTSSTWTYSLTRPDASNSVTMHSAMTLVDASGMGAKTWNFVQVRGNSCQGGQLCEFVQSASAGGYKYTDDTYAWTVDGAGNPYIASRTSVTDPSGANLSALSTQTLDSYGNVTVSKIYPYNNTATPLHFYTNTYATSTTYTSNYVRNRLLSTTDQNSSGTQTLATNHYDACATTGQPAPPCGSAPYSPYGYTAPTTLMDATPPLAFNTRGLLSSSVTPAKTTSVSYYSYGGLAGASASDGTSVSQSADPATNYAAPMTISTQSYGEAVSYNSWLGVTSTAGLNGETLSMTYDSYGRPSTGTSPYGATWTYAYSTSASVWQTKTGPNGFTRTTLDGFGRTIKLERGPSSSNVQSEVDTTYAPCACSPLGKIQAVTAPYAAGSTVYSTVYTYDGIGRATAIQQPDGASTTHNSYSGNQTTVTDPAGNWKTFTNDVLGNLVTVTEPNPAGGTLATSYTYDWMNHLACVSMNRGGTASSPTPYTSSNGVACLTLFTGGVLQTRAFSYDNAGRLVSAVNPENGTVTYTYNTDNTLQDKHDAKGQDVVYTYDGQKRLIEVQKFPYGISGGEYVCEEVNYSYDTNPMSSSFSQYSIGRLTLAQYNFCNDSTGSTTFFEQYSYHPAGAVTAKNLQVSRDTGLPGGRASTWNAVPDGLDAGGLTVSYTYTGTGQVNTTTYPVDFSFSGGPVTFQYGYDSMSRPVSLQDNNPDDDDGIPATAWVKNGAYDYAGRTSSLQFVSGWGGTGYPVYTTEGRGYNTDGQLAALTWGNPGPDPQIQYIYSGTQNNGQITQAKDSLSAETITYQYDALKRLTSASSTPNSGSTPTAWTQSFTYDGFGNLTGKTLNGTTTAIGVDATTNRLSPGSYDSNGNMTSGVGGTLGYDTVNRLVSFAPISGGTESYAYAPDNKRVDRLHADGSTEDVMFYGAQGEKLGVFALTVNYFDEYMLSLSGIRSSNIWYAGKLIYNDWPVTQDRLGSTRIGLGASSRYYPYGEEITTTSNDRVKFATYTRDSFTGLDYADQRFYASSYGRFNSPDASKRSARVKLPGSWNRYTYVLSDPVNHSDRRGLEEDLGDSGGCWWDDENQVLNCSATGTASGDGGGGGGETCSENLYQAECDGGDGPGTGAVGGSTSPLPQCTPDQLVGGVIEGAAAKAGLDLSGLSASVQIVGSTCQPGTPECGANGTYTQTELNLTGDVSGLSDQLALLNGDGFACNPGSGLRNIFIGPPHNLGQRGSVNCRQDGLTNSLQANVNVAAGVAQLDVDPYNPAALFGLGSILHGILQVLPNKITGGDSNYASIALALGISLNCQP